MSRPQSKHALPRLAAIDEDTDDEDLIAPNSVLPLLRTPQKVVKPRQPRRAPRRPRVSRAKVEQVADGVVKPEQSLVSQVPAQQPPAQQAEKRKHVPTSDKRESKSQLWAVYKSKIPPQQRSLQWKTSTSSQLRNAIKNSPTVE